MILTSHRSLSRRVIIFSLTVGPPHFCLLQSDTLTQRLLPVLETSVNESQLSTLPRTHDSEHSEHHLSVTSAYQKLLKVTADAPPRFLTVASQAHCSTLRPRWSPPFSIPTEHHLRPDAQDTKSAKMADTSFDDILRYCDPTISVSITAKTFDKLLGWQHDQGLRWAKKKTLQRPQSPSDPV